MTLGPTAARDSAAPPPTPTEVESLVRSLVAMMRDSALTELDVAFGNVSITLRGKPAQDPRPDAGASLSTATAPTAVAPDLTLTAPMIGTFYASPSPGAPPFVEAGDAVVVGQIVGIIEAMKIMNEIPAEKSGLVEETLVTNGQAVEFGTPLLRLRPTEVGAR